MATLLEIYYDLSNDFDNSILANIPGPAEIWHQQELLYRIGVLDTAKMFGKTAPQSADPKDLCWHYQMMDAFFQSLTCERRYGLGADENLKKQRETAHGNLLQVIQDYKKRLGSFTPGSDAGYYKKTITNVIQTVLPVWIQYRQTYVEIEKEAAK